MEPHRAAQALAAASASMTGPDDVGGALAALLQHTRVGLDVDACGILVESAPAERLTLLAASSHEASELEVHQAEIGEGPCVEAHAGGVAVQAGAAQARDRWPVFGRTMEASGFASVHASPLMLAGSPIGAMGLFRRGDAPLDVDEQALAQAFADIASMLVVHLGEVSPQRLTARLGEILSSRIAVERAKGVLAEVHGISMAEAYDLLVQRARDRGEALSAWAQHVIADAQTR
jgi:hypothetical protein